MFVPGPASAQLRAPRSAPPPSSSPGPPRCGGGTNLRDRGLGAGRKPEPAGGVSWRLRVPGRGQLSTRRPRRWRALPPRGPPRPAARPRLRGSSRSLPRGGSRSRPAPAAQLRLCPLRSGPEGWGIAQRVSPRLAQLPGEPGALGVWTHMPLEMATSWNSRAMAPGKRVKAQPESLSLTRPSPLSLKAAL